MWARPTSTLLHVSFPGNRYGPDFSRTTTTTTTQNPADICQHGGDCQTAVPSREITTDSPEEIWSGIWGNKV